MNNKFILFLLMGVVSHPKCKETFLKKERKKNLKNFFQLTSFKKHLMTLV